MVVVHQGLGNEVEHEGRVTEAAERSRAEDGTVEAVAPVLAQHPQRRAVEVVRFVGDRVQEILDLAWRGQAGQQAALFFSQLCL